jgi:hypothetical protein
MKKEFLPYKESLALKKLGFNEPCFGAYYADGELVPHKWYDNNNHRIENGKFTAPLWQQAFRWFRRKHKLSGEFWDLPKSTTVCIRDSMTNYTIWNDNFKTYEKAELACIRKLIEITKTKIKT